MYYWHQLRLIREEAEPGDRILEIGVGTKFTSNYLFTKGYDITTMDIDANKQPDIVADLVTVEFTESYDYILAFEVFEHLPFEDFCEALQKLHKHCRKGLLLSVPRNEKPWLSVRVELPGRKQYGFRIATRRNKIISKYHHWEVDYPPVSKKVLENAFRNANFHIKTWMKMESLYFYVLTNRS